MKKNYLGLLSIFAILGLFGFISESKALLGFFGFSYYIRYFYVTPDELFIQNVQRAASIGFFSGIAATGVSTLLNILFPALITAPFVLVSCFVVSIFAFTIALCIIETREDWGN